MAENIEKKFLGTAGVQQLIANTRGEIATAEQAAKDYADSLADNYDAAGTAQTKVNELANGQVKTNTGDINLIKSALNVGGSTYNAIADARKAGTDASAHADELNTAMNTRVEALEAIDHDHSNKTQLDSYDKTQTELLAAASTDAQGKVDTLANGAVATNTQHIGTMDNLETTAKADLVTAINEVRNAVSAGGTAAAMTMEEKTTGLGEGVAKAYVLKQGDNTIGTINIPKDMVVQSGSVVVNPEGQAAGTYIKLVLANATNDEIFVNVGNLVDIYTAKASAAQVQLAIDPSTREISATIVAGSVTATELAADAVTTVKIADGNVTKAKLSTEVQTILQTAEDDHTILGFINASLNTGGSTYNAIADARKAGTDASAHADSLNTAMNTRVEALEAIDHDHSNKTQLDTYDKTQTELLAAAKAEAEGLIDGVDLSGIATNAGKIETLEGTVEEHGANIDNNANAILAIENSLKEGGATANAIAEAKKAGTDASAHADSLNTAMNTRVEALESVSYVEITADDIDAMFAPAT